MTQYSVKEYKPIEASRNITFQAHHSSNIFQHTLNKPLPPASPEQVNLVILTYQPTPLSTRKQLPSQTSHPHRTMGASDVCLVILAIFLPPIATLLKRGCGVDLLINILLTLCGHIPGVIHALYLILHDRERRREQPLPQQTNAQAMYGNPQPAYGNKQPEYNQAVQTIPQPQQAQPAYAEPSQPAMQPQGMPPTYSDYTERDIAGASAGVTQNPARAEKHEYRP